MTDKKDFYTSDEIIPFSISESKLLGKSAALLDEARQAELNRIAARRMKFINVFPVKDDE